MTFRVTMENKVGVGPKTYRCQAIMPNGMRCGRYVENQEENGMWTCRNCHERFKRAIAEKIEEDTMVLMGEVELHES